MSYVDGFVMVTKNPKAYRTMAKVGGKVWKKYGALAYYECFGDDLSAKHVTLPFPKLVKAKRGETVIFSFVIYKSKAHRDAVNKKVMADPIMNDPKWAGKAMPFDMKRVAMGGFKVVVEA
jgi:alkaline phosphatase